jgi:integrase
MPHGPRPGRVGRYWLSRRPGSDAWCRTWFDAVTRQTRRSSLGTDDVRAAERALLEWVTFNEVIGRHDRQPQRLLFATLALRYWQHHGQHVAMSPSIKRILALWTERFGEATVAEMSMARLSAFKRDLEAVGHSSSYVAKIFAMGRRVLSWAHQNGDLDVIPAWPKVTETSTPQRRLTVPELARLVAAIEAESLRRFVVLACCTLARPGAILELTREQCDLAERLISLNPPGRTQTKKRRPVTPMSAAAAKLIEAAEAGLLVHRMGQPVTERWINVHLKKTADRAGIEGQVTGMTFRRTMARELRRRGVESWAVAGIMGHSEARTTEIYAIFDPAEAGPLVQAIDAVCLEISGAGAPRSCLRPLSATSKAYQKRSTD